MKKKGARILIVDDDTSICRTLSLILEDKGHTVQTANTGKEAIEKCSKTMFDVAILDIKLPDIEGTELLKALPQTTSKMVKVVFTGYPELKSAVKALDNGADAYLMKPVDPPALVKTIKEKLQQKANTEKMTEEKITEFLQTRTQQLLNKMQ